MEAEAIRKMRLKQVAVTNGLILATVIALFVITNVFTITYAHFFFVSGLLLLIQGVYGLMKIDSTKSFIFIFEQVAMYEKEKMGREWYKKQRTGHIGNLILGIASTYQSIGNFALSINTIQIDLLFLFASTFFLALLINTRLFFHFRKIDRATSALDMEGYTSRSILVGIAVGIVITFIMSVIVYEFIK